MRIGTRVVGAGPAADGGALADQAAHLEAAGFDSLWCTDHVVMTRDASRSHYPFSDDGRIGWPVDAPMPDVLVVLAQVAAATHRVEVGSAVLVLPQRHPVVLAKQVATLDRLSGGRVVLGVGVGWYREEFEALGWDFATRGARFDEWVDVLRRCWTGDPAPFDGDHLRLPAGVLSRPTPARRVPLLVGGVSDVALRRAATQGDGWLGLERCAHLDVERVATHVERLHEVARTHGRDPADLRVTLRVIESTGRADEVARALPALAEAGVDEVVVDVDVSDGDAIEATAATLLAARGAPDG